MREDKTKNHFLQRKFCSALDNEFVVFSQTLLCNGSTLGSMLQTIGRQPYYDVIKEPSIISPFSIIFSTFALLLSRTTSRLMALILVAKVTAKFITFNVVGSKSQYL